MMAATAGVALGVNSDITTEAAGAVILQSSLAGVDELMHIGRRMRTDCADQRSRRNAAEPGGNDALRRWDI